MSLVITRGLGPKGLGTDHPAQLMPGRGLGLGYVLPTALTPAAQETVTEGPAEDSVVLVGGVAGTITEGLSATEVVLVGGVTGTIVEES